MFEHAGFDRRRSIDPVPFRRPGGDKEDGQGSTNGCAAAVGTRTAVSPTTSWARLCHDLRTPLNAILGNAELLLDGSAGPLSREARGCAADIQTAASRMMRHVQALLELCRARSQPDLAEDSCVDLLALLAAAEPLALSSLPVRVAPTGACFVIRGDATWLELLASVLADLYLGDGTVRSPLEINVERGRQHGTLQLWWADLEPQQVPALPLALIHAILDLHDAELSLTPSGLLLYWPLCRVAQLESAAGVRHGG